MGKLGSIGMLIFLVFMIYNVFIPALMSPWEKLEREWGKTDNGVIEEVEKKKEGGFFDKW